MSTEHEQVNRAIERLKDMRSWEENFDYDWQKQLGTDLRLVLLRIAELERALEDVITIASVAIDGEQIEGESRWMENVLFNPNSTISEPMKYSDSLLSRMKKLDDARALIALDTKGKSE